MCQNKDHDKQSFIYNEKKTRHSLTSKSLSTNVKWGTTLHRVKINQFCGVIMHLPTGHFLSNFTLYFFYMLRNSFKLARITIT